MFLQEIGTNLTYTAFYSLKHDNWHLHWHPKVWKYLNENPPVSLQLLLSKSTLTFHMFQVIL